MPFVFDSQIAKNLSYLMSQIKFLLRRYVSLINAISLS